MLIYPNIGASSALPPSPSANQIAANAFMTPALPVPIVSVSVTPQNYELGGSGGQRLVTLRRAENLASAEKFTIKAGNTANVLTTSGITNRQGQALMAGAHCISTKGYVSPFTFPAAPFTLVWVGAPHPIFVGANAMSDQFNFGTFLSAGTPQRWRLNWRDKIRLEYWDGTQNTTYPRTSSIPVADHGQAHPNFQPYKNNLIFVAVSYDGTNTLYFGNGDTFSKVLNYGGTLPAFTDFTLNGPVLNDGLDIANQVMSGFSLYNTALTNTQLMQLLNLEAAQIGYTCDRWYGFGSSIGEISPLSPSGGQFAGNDIHCRHPFAQAQRMMVVNGDNYPREYINMCRSGKGPNFYATYFSSMAAQIQATPAYVQNNHVIVTSLCTNDRSSGRTVTQIQADVRTLCTNIAGMGRWNSQSKFAISTEICRQGDNGGLQQCNTMLISEFVTGGAGTCKAILEAVGFTVKLFDMGATPQFNVNDQSVLTATFPALTFGGITIPSGSVYVGDGTHPSFLGTAYMAKYWMESGLLS